MSRLALLALSIAAVAWYAGTRSRQQHRAREAADDKARWEGEGGAPRPTTTGSELPR
ncbi:MAG: hypothetical protein JO341_03650 [Gammaproteobacteria bacterium]|nr:hypothetical protein [Gammaproteobacteria bacterium]